MVMFFCTLVALDGAFASQILIGLFTAAMKSLYIGV